jgi:hypothetical protein
VQPAAKTKSKHPRRQELPANLLRVEILACTPEQCVCKGRGQQTAVIGYEESSQLDVEPAKYFVRKIPKNLCRILLGASWWLKTTTDGRGQPVDPLRRRNWHRGFLEAKELRGQRGSKSGRVPAVLFIKTHPVTLVSPVRWA